MAGWLDVINKPVGKSVSRSSQQSWNKVKFGDYFDWVNKRVGSQWNLPLNVKNIFQTDRPPPPPHRGSTQAQGNRSRKTDYQKKKNATRDTQLCDQLMNVRVCDERVEKRWMKINSGLNKNMI